MSLTPPRVPSFLLATILGTAGIAAHMGYFALGAPYAFWLVAAGFVLLVLSTLFSGL